MTSDVMTTRRINIPFSNPDRVHAHYHDILGTRVTTEPHRSAQASPATRALKAMFLPSSRGSKNAAGGTNPRHVGSHKVSVFQDKKGKGCRSSAYSHFVAHVNDGIDHGHSQNHNTKLSDIDAMNV